MAKKRMSYQDILREAEKYQLDKSETFLALIEQYEDEVKLIRKMQREVEKSGLTVTKTYAGKENTYSHPLISEIHDGRRILASIIGEMQDALANLGKPPKQLSKLDKLIQDG